MLYYRFSLEAALQGMTKNNPTEKQIEAKTSKATLKHAPEKIFIGTNIKNRFTSYIATTYRNMFSFWLLFVISKAFLAAFKHVPVCWKSIAWKLLLFWSFNTLPSKQILTQSQQQKPSSKRGNLLKANSRDCVSLLTICSMCKTLFEYFLVYYKRVFVYVFAMTTSFSMYLLSVLKRFQTLTYFYLLSVFYWVQKKPPEVLFKKGDF